MWPIKTRTGSLYRKKRNGKHVGNYIAKVILFGKPIIWSTGTDDREKAEKILAENAAPFAHAGQTNVVAILAGAKEEARAIQERNAAAASAHLSHLKHGDPTAQVVGRAASTEEDAVLEALGYITRLKMSPHKAYLARISVGSLRFFRDASRETGIRFEDMDYRFVVDYIMKSKTGDDQPEIVQKQ